MTTLKDLSRYLGLSVTQVSRAINNHGDVSEETLKRVHDAAKALNYRPNVSARRLVTGRSGIVGLVLHGVPRYAVAAFRMHAVGTMSKQFARHGLHFMLHVADESENPVDVYRSLVSSGAIDGLVLLEPVVNDPRIAYLRSQKFPFVLHGRTQPEPDYPYFDIDNEHVGYRLTRLLIDQGHRRIALFNDVSPLTYARSRRQGYLRALKEAGITPEASYYRQGAMTEGFGLREAVRLLERKNHRPTGFIAGNPSVAKGVYAAIRAFDLSVPGDVSVVAHDDMLPNFNLAKFEPALTCTRSPVEASAEPLSDFLFGALNGQPVSELQRVDIPETVLRDSIAPCCD